MTSIITLRDAFVKGLKCVRRSNNSLAPVNPKQIDALINAVSVDSVNSLQLGSAATLFSNGANFGMYPMDPLKSPNPLDYTCFQFGQGRVGWYFMYGHLGGMAFTF